MGISSWVSPGSNVSFGSVARREVNELAESVPVGSDGVTVLPFGNGAERVLGNKNIGAQIATRVNFVCTALAFLIGMARFSEPVDAKFNAKPIPAKPTAAGSLPIRVRTHYIARNTNT